MRNLVLLIAMVATGIAGYAIGSYQGREAQAALARISAAADVAQKEHDRAVEDLGNRLREQTADYEREKNRINEEHRKQRANWVSALDGRERRIKELTAASAGTRGEIDHLRALLVNVTDGEERRLLAAQIAVLEKQLKEQQANVAGLECSKAKVPSDLLTNLTGSAP